MSLAKKAAHGIAWVTLSTILIRLFNFVTKIALARLLDPTDFGLLVIGLLAINAMGLFRDLGFGAALIYKKDDSNHTAANTAFLLLPVVATILFALAYLSAPYVAVFFNTAAVEPIIRILALTFIISSFGTVPSMLLEKELEFRKKVIPEVVPIVGYACVTIGLALQGYGVWSLVYGQITSAILVVVLIWMVSDWRPTFSFDKVVAKELFGYGKHILGASVVIFLITNLDNAIVGKMLGMEALGYYMIAYTISNLPATQITHLVGQVMFPTYSKLQDDRDALRRAYLKTLKYVSMLSVPAALGIFVVAPEFVSVALGEKWMPAVPALQIMCFYGLFRSLNGTTGPVFQATGNPKTLQNIALLNLILFCIFVLPLMQKYGIAGVSIAGTLPQIIIFSVVILCIKRILILKNRELIFILKPQAISTLMATIVSSSFKYILPINTDLMMLVTGFSIFTSIYFVSTYLFDSDVFSDFKNIIKQIR